MHRGVLKVSRNAERGLIWRDRHGRILGRFRTQEWEGAVEFGLRQMAEAAERLDE